MKVSDIEHHWNGDHNAMARSCGVSRNSIINWINAGKIPKLQAIKLEFEVLPEVIRRRVLEDALEAQLREEFDKPLFD